MGKKCVKLCAMRWLAVIKEIIKLWCAKQESKRICKENDLVRSRRQFCELRGIGKLSRCNENDRETDPKRIDVSNIEDD